MLTHVPCTFGHTVEMVPWLNSRACVGRLHFALSQLNSSTLNFLPTMVIMCAMCASRFCKASYVYMSLGAYPSKLEGHSVVCLGRHAMDLWGSNHTSTSASHWINVCNQCSISVCAVTFPVSEAGLACRVRILLPGWRLFFCLLAHLWWQRVLVLSPI